MNSYTRIELFDLAGRKLQTLIDGNIDAGDPTLSAGRHNVQLNRGQLKAGVYFLKVKMNNQAFTKKIIIQ